MKMKKYLFIIINYIMSKIKENTFLQPELHSQVVAQSEITGASKSAIIAEAVKVYYSMDIDERIARVNNRIKELKEECHDPNKFKWSIITTDLEKINILIDHLGSKFK